MSIFRNKKKSASAVLFILVAALYLPNTSLAGEGVGELPPELRGVKVKNSLGKTIPKELTFTDHRGKKVLLGDYFKGKNPIILTLNYFRCPMLCSMQLNGLVETVNQLPPGIVKKSLLITVSFDPEDSADVAREKRKNYLAQLKTKPKDWVFLVGERENIQKLTKLLGFYYRYIPEQRQYAHPAVVYILTPKGRVSQYLSGVKFQPRDLKFALITASEEKLGSVIDRFIMSCFVYNSVEGKYTTFAWGIVRLSGFFTLLLMSIFLGIFWIRERKRKV